MEIFGVTWMLAPRPPETELVEKLMSEMYLASSPNPNVLLFTPMLRVRSLFTSHSTPPRISYALCSR